MTERVSLGCGLTLHPKHVEAAFWKSSTYQQLAARLDTWGTVMGIGTNLLMLRFHARQPPGHDLRNFSYVMCATHVAVSILRQLWMVRARHSYFRWRITIQVVQRIHRLLTTALVCQRVLRHPPTSTAIVERMLCAALPAAPAAPAAPHSLPASTLLVAFRNLMLISAAVTPLVHSCTIPLPLALQLAVQLAYFLHFALFTGPRLLPLLNSATCAPSALPLICTTINTLPDLYHTALLRAHPSASAPASPLTTLCHLAPAPFLLLFIQLTAVVLLPTYLSYRLEQHAKQAFVLHLRTTTPAPPATLSPCSNPQPSTSDPLATLRTPHPTLDNACEHPPPPAAPGPPPHPQRQPGSAHGAPAAAPPSHDPTASTTRPTPARQAAAPDPHPHPDCLDLGPWQQLGPMRDAMLIPACVFFLWHTAALLHPVLLLLRPGPPLQPAA